MATAWRELPAAETLSIVPRAFLYAAGLQLDPVQVAGMDTVATSLSGDGLYNRRRIRPAAAAPLILANDRLREF